MRISIELEGVVWECEVGPCVVHTEGEFGGNVDLSVQARPELDPKALGGALRIRVPGRSESLSAIAWGAAPGGVGLTFHDPSLDGAAAPPQEIALLGPDQSELARVPCTIAPPESEAGEPVAPRQQPTPSASFPDHGPLRVERGAETLVDDRLSWLRNALGLPVVVLGAVLVAQAVNTRDEVLAPVGSLLLIAGGLMALIPFRRLRIDPAAGTAACSSAWAPAGVVVKTLRPGSPARLADLVEVRVRVSVSTRANSSTSSGWELALDAAREKTAVDFQWYASYARARRAADQLGALLDLPVRGYPGRE